MAGARYGKTERGRVELQQRRGGLDAATRALLILCNGRVGADELRAQCGAGSDERLLRLIELGLVEVIERVDRPAAHPTTPSPARAPAAAPQALAAAADALARPMAWLRTLRPGERPSELPSGLGLSSQLPSVLPSGLSAVPDLRGAKLRALALTQRLFGPGGGSQMQDLMRAADADAFERGLQALREMLLVYHPRREVDAMLRTIRGQDSS